MQSGGSPGALGVSIGRRRGLRVFWLLLSLGAASWIVWSSRDDIDLLAESSVWVIVSMISLHIVGLLTQSEKFRLVLEHHSDSKLRLGSWTRLFVRGRLFSYLLPQTGHVYRGVALQQDHAMPSLQYVSSLATQTWMGTLASLSFATIVAWLASQYGDGSRLADSIPILVGSVVLVGFGPLLIVGLSRYMPSRVRRMRLAIRAKEAWFLARRSAQSTRLVFTFLIYVIIALISGAIALKIAFLIAGQEVGWSAAVVIIAFMHLGNVVSITPGNLGIQELGVAGIGAFLGYPAGAGVVASLVVRLSNIVALSILALFLEVEGLVRGRPRVH